MTHRRTGRANVGVATNASVGRARASPGRLTLAGRSFLSSLLNTQLKEFWIYAGQTNTITQTKSVNN